MAVGTIWWTGLAAAILCPISQYEACCPDISRGPARLKSSWPVDAVMFGSSVTVNVSALNVSDTSVVASRPDLEAGALLQRIGTRTHGGLGGMSPVRSSARLIPLETA